MATAEPIIDLAGLLSEEKSLERRITETREALAAVRTEISDSLRRGQINVAEGRLQIEEELMKREQSYEHLLQALQEMKDEIQSRIKPFEQEVIRASVENLKDRFDQQKNVLEDCLRTIDQRILDCRNDIEEYRRIHSDLNHINEKLTRLSTETLPIPDSLPTENITEIITGRIEHLRLQGKL